MEHRTEATTILAPEMGEVVADIAYFRRRIGAAGPDGSSEHRDAVEAYGPSLARRFQILAAMADGRRQHWREYPTPEALAGAGPVEAATRRIR